MSNLEVVYRGMSFEELLNAYFDLLDSNEEVIREYIVMCSCLRDRECPICGEVGCDEGHHIERCVRCGKVICRYCGFYDDDGDICEECRDNRKDTM